MNCSWIKITQNLQKGILVINQLDDTKFEQFLKRIVIKLRLQDTEIFTVDERKKLQVIFKIDEETLLIAIKTIIYLYKRLLKFIFMPVDLQKDLMHIGFNNEKTEFIVKMWSLEISPTLSELASKESNKCGESLNFSWKLNTELSSSLQKKCKIPKAYLLISNEKEENEMELTHSDLYAMFIQLESIQNDLDNLIL
ncbi:unnamed protein product [Parnassius mnemosyne]|uniref:COMM domain-containing protein n=1 Tax=Parnassius mnemosyne TaxID=213953 RepID=A0AAV1KDH0_9NEOP